MPKMRMDKAIASVAIFTPEFTGKGLIKSNGCQLDRKSTSNPKIFGEFQPRFKGVHGF